jgi:hypothetical protein
MALRAANTSIHRLKVTLAGIRPPVWRRVEVPSTITLADLHAVIQGAMGWWNCHLHQWLIDGVTYGIDDGEGWGPPPVDERRAKLRDVAPEGARLAYEYDFGDLWKHRIEVEAIAPAEPGVTYPRCVAGRRACPPEDCGGPWGYGDFLAAIADPEHEEHDSWLTWAGGRFDPGRFDLAEVNARLGSQ